MDIATILGLALGTALLLGSIMIGGPLSPFIDVPSMMITIGGACAAILINFPLNQVFSVMSIIKKCFLSKLPSTTSVIERFKALAVIARRDGLLALESEVEQANDVFLKRGLEMVIGGSNRDDLTGILETEISYIEQRHQTGKKMVDAMAAAAPAFGMIGTLIGLIQMLRTLDDPSKIGGGMAVALLTTLYGALVANFICIPLAGKLEMRSREEVLIRELMLSGLVCLVDGNPPRIVEERLLAFISPGRRPVPTTQAA
ncbi:MAG: motility protein A [Planctomycetaceae bacterium]